MHVCKTKTAIVIAKQWLQNESRTLAWNLLLLLLLLRLSKILILEALVFTLNNVAYSLKCTHNKQTNNTKKQSTQRYNQ